MRPSHLSVVCLTLVAAGVSACGSGTSDEDKVRSVVQRFAEASAKKDYNTICDQLLSRSLTDTVEEYGLPCELALQKGLGSTQAPKLAIRKVTISKAGTTAAVVVHSTAANQPPSDDTLQLRWENKSWRIASLTAPPKRAPVKTKTTTTPAKGK